MRIDLNTRIPELPEKEKSVNSKAPAPAAADATERASDQVRLSFDHAAVQALEAQVHATPELRSERVTALQHATRDGTYQVAPTKIADAIFKEFLARSSRIR